MDVGQWIGEEAGYVGFNSLAQLFDKADQGADEESRLFGFIVASLWLSKGLCEHGKGPNGFSREI